jgi:response regulator RpfG family c-di-GMP phosphodiesterase
MNNCKSASILLVDDEQGILNSLNRMLKPLEIPILTAHNGTLALEIVEREELALIISDNRMPGISGIEFLTRAKELKPDAIRILLTGHADIETTIDAINSGAIRYYVPKPWDDEQLLSRIHESLELYRVKCENLRLTQLTKDQNRELLELNRSLEERVLQQTETLRQQHSELQRSFLETIKAFATLVEMRHKEVGSHSQRVSATVRQLAGKLGLRDKELQDCVVAAYLHDIGKISYPDSLLARSPDRPGGADWETVSKHPILGQSSVQVINGFEEIGLIIRHHHENFDGTGYPDNLTDKQIPLGSRLIRIADAFDHHAFTAGYPNLRTLNEASAYLVKEASTLFDPELVKLFIDLDIGRQYIQNRGTETVVLKPFALKKGMIVAADVFSATGMFILPKGTRLSTGVINRLVKIDRFDQLSKGITVYKDLIDEEEDNATIQDFVSRRFS